VRNEVTRYGRASSILGLIVLIFIGLSFLADRYTAQKMAFLFGGYKILIPISIWVISFLTPGKEIFKKKKPAS
jgi:hypothetical protein